LKQLSQTRHAYGLLVWLRGMGDRHARAGLRYDDARGQRDDVL